jgi:hypothetical protein
MNSDDPIVILSGARTPLGEKAAARYAAEQS